MADSPVLYVYYRPDNDDAYPGVPNRHITEADWARFSPSQRRTVEQATTQEGYTRRKVWVHRDLVDETEQERADREAAEQAAREAYERGQSLVRYREFAKLVPGPGEVIVGGADGPVARSFDLDGITQKAEAIVTLPQVATGLRWGFLGDSITHGIALAANDYRKTYCLQAVYMAGGTIARSDSVEAGVSGQRTDQILARLPGVLNYPTDAIAVLMGTNDANQAVPLATFIQNMTAFIRQVKAAGKPLVIGTVPPQGPARGQTNHRLVGAYNLWIRMYAPTFGCEVADYHAALVDANGNLLPAYDSGDGIHPNVRGHAAMAAELTRAMRRAANKDTSGVVFAPSVDNKMPDPLNARSAVLGDGWTEVAGGTGTAPTYSFVADTSGFLKAGRWAEMSFDGTASGGTRTIRGPQIADPTALNKVAVTMHLQIEAVAGDWVAAVMNNTAHVKPSVVTNTGAVIGGSEPLGLPAPGVPNTPGSNVYNIGPTFRPFGVWPSGMPYMQFQIEVKVPTGMHVKVRWGQVGLIDTTAAGFGTMFDWSSSIVYKGD